MVDVNSIHAIRRSLLHFLVGRGYRDSADPAIERVCIAIYQLVQGDPLIIEFNEEVRDNA